VTSNNTNEPETDTAPDEASAPEPSDGTMYDGLVKRLTSAVFLIPISLGFVYLGGWPFALSLIFVTALMAFEWNRLVLGQENREKIIVYFALYTSFLAGVLGLGLEGHWRAALGVCVLAAIMTLLLALQHKVKAVWPFVGVPYLFLPMMSFIWLREAEWGLTVIIWILLVVWGSDSGGYLAGKSIGGPKLAPKISPNKTWSGFVGGVALAMLAGFGVGLFVGDGSILKLIMVSAGLSAISQVGDLAESAVKRHFGVKDFSSLIPGHGGVLDRFDGLLFVLVAAAVIQLGHAGTILIWP
jgi:phosphatidate cytidylyltransferase